ncbi:hypothetical protein BK754_28350 [Bacillus thuringiensis serovar subtoxicus]|uniref:Uncharacterized protein n=2 Tax=Bacillales TaxID=1385 RepID=A0A9X6IJ24_BACTU|nr:hypothetical protein [Bacillus thuringiensis]MRA85546.1 hypothetical protein [Bacillus thuringiensis]OTY85446.1 hypothetical protein BK754_28350 [Bacillus thuringiensis serovar subtoxicus]UJP62357.1 hypothetical protein JRY14_12335 [Bacillus thuringiensis]
MDRKIIRDMLGVFLMRQIKKALPKDQYKPSMKDKKEMESWLKEMLEKDKYWSKMKRGPRYKFTRVARWCEQCNKQLEARNDYQMRYGFCDVYCGEVLYGLRT